MSELINKVISELHSIGLDLRDIGGGWFALHSSSAFLYLNESDVLAYLDAMPEEDIDGAFGSNLEVGQARHSLFLLHIEEALEAGSSVSRYVVIDKCDIRVFAKEDSLPCRPPGDYQWQASQG